MIRKFILLLLCFAPKFSRRVDISIKTNLKIKAIFVDYMNKFNIKITSPAQEKKAVETFAESVEEIAKFQEDKSHSYEIGINPFSHLTWEEFESQKLMKNGDFFLNKTAINIEIKSNSGVSIFKSKLADSTSNWNLFSFKGRRLQSVSRTRSSISRDFTIPNWVNWKNFAGKVKDQGVCSACYVFAGNGAYETLLAMKYGQRYDLSSQEIIDCSVYDNGCVGGNPASTFLYGSLYGLATERVYPFTQKKGICRRINSNSKVFYPVRYKYINPDIFSILESISKGPMVLIHTATKNFKQYKSGVFDDPDCSGKLNHSAVAVGYDLTAKIPYIYLKNGWGAWWGEDGYYKLAIGDLSLNNKGICGMMTHPYNSQPYFN